MSKDNEPMITVKIALFGSYVYETLYEYLLPYLKCQKEKIIVVLKVSNTKFQPMIGYRFGRSEPRRTAVKYQCLFNNVKYQLLWQYVESHYRACMTHPFGLQ